MKMKILEDYFNFNSLVDDEYESFPLEVKGTVPKRLNGTLFRNGNGRHMHYGVKYQHLFDGDGMVSKYSIHDGIILYSNKHIKTAEFLKEEDAGKFLYRGFGTNKPGGLLKNLLDMRFKNAANTSIAFHAGRLLALWEGGLPHLIDPKTLRTEGRFDYAGMLINKFGRIDKLITPELPFSAHPKFDPDTGVLHNFGTAPGITNRLIRYEIKNDGKASIAGVTKLKKLFFTHDFVLTESGYKIFFLTPVNFNLFRAFSGLDTPVGSMEANKDLPIKILVIDKQGNEIELETSFGFIFHFINGYEMDDQIIIDGLMLPDWPSAEGMKKFLNGEAEETIQSKPTRYVLDLTSRSVTKQNLASYYFEFPEINKNKSGKPYRYAWGIASPINNHKNPLLDGLLKLDHYNRLPVYRELPHSLLGEPIHVSSAHNEDDGTILIPVFDGKHKSTEIHGYKSKNLEWLFSAQLPHNIPLGFHGCWVEQLF